MTKVPKRWVTFNAEPLGPFKSKRRVCSWFTEILRSVLLEAVMEQSFSVGMRTSMLCDFLRSSNH